jgi:hypothetical protein
VTDPVPPEARLVFDPEPGGFDAVTWRSPVARKLRPVAIVSGVAALLTMVLTRDWSSGLSFIGVFAGSAAVAWGPGSMFGAGPIGLDAGRFAIPWERVAGIDDDGHVHLDPPASMSKAVTLSGQMPKVQLGSRRWSGEELARAAEAWAPRLLLSEGVRPGSGPVR